MWLLSSLPSVKGCGRSLLRDAGAASVMVGPDGAGYAGLNRCSSVSACAVCSARIRQGRSEQIEAAGVEWLNRGGQLAFLTLTLPHDRADALADTLGVIRKAWRSVQQSKGYRDQREGRLFGFVRSLEVTRGANGWHPHVHVLLFLDASCGAAGLDALTDAMRSAWDRAVVKAGYRKPSAAHGVRAQLVHDRNDGAGSLARYLTKVQDEFGGGTWGVGAEMVRGDLKAGKRAGSRVPFEIAVSAAAGNPADLLLWHEYEQATKGVRIVEASRGLLAALYVEEVEDDEVSDVDEDAVEVARINAEDWRLVCRYGADCDVLEAAEVEGAAGVERVLAALRLRAGLVLSG
jgi:hypothetical protein